MAKQVRALAAVLVASAAVTARTPAASAATAAPYCAAAKTHGPSGQNAAPADGIRGCRYDTGLSTEDPGIAVTRNGTVFVAKGSGGVLRSTDGGRHWTDITVPDLPNGDTHANGTHGFVHVDVRTDRVYYLTSMTGVTSCGGSSGAIVSWSSDLGKTWHGATIDCDTYDWGRIVSGPPPPGTSYPSAVYFFGVAPRPVGGTRLVSRSLDGGATWTRMKNIASATTESGAGVTAPDGTIYFDYPEFLGFDPTRVANTTYPFKPENLCRQMIAVSEDYGTTWRQEAIPGSLACNELYGQERVAVDRAGTVYTVWNDDVTGRLSMVFSRDKAHTWSSPVDVMPPGATFNNSHGNIVAGAPGHVFIAQQDTTAAVNPRVGIAQGNGDWHTYVTESTDATAAAPHFTSADLDAAGDPTYATGQSPTEAEVYLAMTPEGTGWTVFSRHGSPPLGSGNEVYVGTLEHPATDAAARPPVKRAASQHPNGPAPVQAPDRTLAATGATPAAAMLAALLVLLATAVLRRRRAIA